VINAEAKLVRLLMESHGFQATDGQEWNLMWTCDVNRKQFLMEQLSDN
jgi:hypothetical protein